MKETLRKTCDVWSRQESTWVVGRGIHWMEHPTVRMKRLNKLVSGDENVDLWQYSLKLLSQFGVQFPVPKSLSLGCGFGALEIALCEKYNFSNSHEAYDLASGAIDRASRLADEKGLKSLKFNVMDLNEIQLAENKYDLVICQMGLHHIAQLEHLFKTVADSMKTSGFFVINEYVGPNRFQWPEEQRQAVNHLLGLLPERYRRLPNGELKVEAFSPRLEEVIAADPSEAVRSADILPLIREYFLVIEEKDYGGNMLHLLLNNIAMNFEESRSVDMRMLEWLFDYEDLYLHEPGVVSDFKLLIVRRP